MHLIKNFNLQPKAIKRRHFDRIWRLLTSSCCWARRPSPPRDKRRGWLRFGQPKPNQQAPKQRSAWPPSISRDIYCHGPPCRQGVYTILWGRTWKQETRWLLGGSGMQECISPPPRCPDFREIQWQGERKKKQAGHGDAPLLAR